MDQAARLRLLSKTSSSKRAGIKRPRTIAVTSGASDIGKSNLAANLSVLLSSRGIKTAIVDADMGTSNTQALLGRRAFCTLEDLTRNAERIANTWIGGSSGMRIFSAGPSIDWLAELTSDKRRELISHAIEEDLGIDALVIDTASGISDEVIDFLGAADEVLISTIPEPTALMDCYALIKTFFGEGLKARVELVINSVPDRQAAERVAHCINSNCIKFLRRTFDAWSWVPSEPGLSTAIARQRPIVDLFPGSRMAKQLRLASIEVMSRLHSRKDLL